MIGGEFKDYVIEVRCSATTYRAAVDFVHHVKDLLLAFCFPLVLIDVTTDQSRKEVDPKQTEKNRELKNGARTENKVMRMKEGRDASA